MVLKQKYVTKESAIASYSYTDLAEGTGVIVFYGSDTDDNGTVTYQLSKNVVYSANLLTEATGTGGADQKIIDVDFDVIFNMPQRIKGKVIANIPVIVGDEVTANNGGSVWAKVLVRHWDGTTETDLASNTESLTTTGTANQDTTQTMLNVEVDVATLKLFKKGETLRLTVEIYAATQDANGCQAGLMHDPKDRIPTSADYSNGIDAGEFITSIISFNVPFIIPTL